MFIPFRIIGTDHAKATRPHETEQKLTNMGQENSSMPISAPWSKDLVASVSLKARKAQCQPLGLPHY